MSGSTPDMRVTRGRTGKLPTPAMRKGFVTGFEDDNDSAPPLPTPSRKSLPEAEFETLELVPDKIPDPVFNVFETPLKLKGGLCIIRELGGGKYEIVSLKDVDGPHFTSEAVGATIMADAERRSMMAVDEKDWAAAKYNCGQAIRSADKDIFRLRKLPFEIRLMIYELAMISPYPLYHDDESETTPQILGLGLMSCSKAMLEETRPIFYKNTFRIDMCDRDPPPFLLTIRPNLREVTFTWNGFNRKNSNAIKFFHSCPNLKILNLRLSDHIVLTAKVGGARTSLHANAAVRKFGPCRGFDAIAALRNFEKVRVTKEPKSKHMSDTEVKNYQDFLESKLIVSKNIQLPKKAAKVKKSKKPRKSKKNDDYESDSDYNA